MSVKTREDKKEKEERRRIQVCKLCNEPGPMTTALILFKIFSIAPKPVILVRLSVGFQSNIIIEMEKEKNLDKKINIPIDAKKVVYFHWRGYR